MIAIAALVAAPSRAHADEAGRGVFEGEVGFGLVYGTTDLVGGGVQMGFTIGKPILDICYVEPVVSFEYDFTQSSRVTAMLRCNFVTSVGQVISIGLGAGTGQHATSDDSGNVTLSERNFREVEIAYKVGGHRRFLIGLALTFDGPTNEQGALLLQTTLLRAGP